MSSSAPSAFGSTTSSGAGSLTFAGLTRYYVTIGACHASILAASSSGESAVFS